MIKKLLEHAVVTLFGVLPGYDVRLEERLIPTVEPTYYPPPPPAVPEELRELRKENERLREEIKLDNDLLKRREQLLDALPCPDHGPCVPHALQEIARLQEVDRRARAAEGATGQERPDWYVLIAAGSPSVPCLPYLEDPNGGPMQPPTPEEWAAHVLKYADALRRAAKGAQAA